MNSRIALKNSKSADNREKITLLNRKRIDQMSYENTSQNDRNNRRNNRRIMKINVFHHEFLKDEELLIKIL